MDKHNPAITKLSLRILRAESIRLNLSVDSIETSLKVCERLRDPISQLAGVMGFHSLLTRALSLAMQDQESLRSLQFNSEGFFLEISEYDFDLGKVNFEGAGQCLINCLLALLVTFIGEVLTSSILEEIWPLESTQCMPDPVEEKDRG